MLEMSVSYWGMKCSAGYDVGDASVMLGDQVLCWM